MRRAETWVRGRALRYGTACVLNVLRWLPGLLLLVPWLLAPVAPSEAVRIRDLSSTVSFRLLDWETVHVGERVGALWAGLTTSTSATRQATRACCAATSQNPHPAALHRPLRQRWSGSWPRRTATTASTRTRSRFRWRASFRRAGSVTAPPNVLVVAPRNELRVIDSSVLEPMDVAAQERLEASVDSNDVSSLVAPIGGLATYPSMVLDNDAAEPVLAASAHEWVHQYLIFYPLGKGYWCSQETREINETTAEMVGEEVGGGIAASIGLAAPVPTATSSPTEVQAPAFDFRTFMRDTRRRRRAAAQLPARWMTPRRTCARGGTSSSSTGTRFGS